MENSINKISDYVLKLVNSLFSFLILAMIVALVAYAGVKTFNIFFNFDLLGYTNVLHEAALLIVFVKAYRVLLNYYKQHTVSIKYIVEISIIAPAIDVVFGSASRDIWITILFTVFSLGNLVLYLYFYDKLSGIEKSECKNECGVEGSKNS